jgi:hypothetical protein
MSVEEQERLTREAVTREAVTGETLQGWVVPALAGEQELRAALEQAFDYRGDVTLTLKSGETVVGYAFDRRTGRSLTDSFVRLLPQEGQHRREIAYAEIAALAFTGRDTAAGKSWEAWVRKYQERKRPEKAISGCFRTKTSKAARIWACRFGDVGSFCYIEFGSRGAIV